MNKQNLLDGETLCKECGLCCAGVFHTFAHLYENDDILFLKDANIPIEFNDELNSNIFKLQCPAFNGLCSIYTNRPSACTHYQCDLLKSVLCDAMTLNNALNKVSEIKNILNDILPVLKTYNKNHTSNKPQYLMSYIMDNIKNKSDRDRFKQENKTLFIKYGIFCFLVDKYFSKNSTTK